MNSTEIKCLFGSRDLEIKPARPYAKEACEFLDAFSKEIRKDGEAKKYPDIMAFAFWIRKSSIHKMKESWQGGGRRLGKGLVFHIAPSNVPVNFAYTFAFGLLAGDSNVVKVPSRQSAQTDILCRLLKRMAEDSRYRWVERQNLVVTYDRDKKEATDYFSKICDCRVIWGGDATIAQVRKSPLQPRSTEITFADRYSMGILPAEKILQADEKELDVLAEQFYNDTYLMDQNACSSPHLVCWVGKEEDASRAQGRFWEKVHEHAAGYDLADVKVSEKYTMLCRYAQQFPGLEAERYGNLLYVVKMKELPKEITLLRGKFGLFFDCRVDSLEELAGSLNDKKVQTCAVYGIDGNELAEMVVAHHLMGVDRIVPVGRTLDIGVFWDGYDVIGELSRCIVCGENM